MSLSIYQQHGQDFNTVSAYIILKDGIQKGIISIKHPKNYNGFVTLYFHLYGQKMEKVRFKGCYSYDIKHGLNDIIFNMLEDDKKSELNESLTDDEILFLSAILKDGFEYDTQSQEFNGFNILRAL